MNVSREFGIIPPTTSVSEEALSVDELLPKLNAKRTNDFIGIEVEIEKVCDVDTAQRYLMRNASDFRGLWHAKPDGSLRNMGIEFVSSPIHTPSVNGSLNWLYEFIKGTLNKAADFSERTGIHFHVDMCRMGYTQILSFTMLYMMYESEFFALAGGERENNNFCVPLRNQTPWYWFPTTDSLQDLGNHLPRADQGKYSALNFTRLRDLGTLEFRHCPGTWDVDQLTCFVQCIQRIKDFVTKRENIAAFNTFLGVANSVSSWRQMTDTIFKDLSHVIWPDGRPSTSIEEGVTFVKKFKWLVEVGGVANIPANYMEFLKNPEFSKQLGLYIEKKKVPMRAGKAKVAAPPREEDEWVIPPRVEPNWNNLRFRVNAPNAAQNQPQELRPIQRAEFNNDILEDDGGNR